MGFLSSDSDFVLARWWNRRRAARTNSREALNEEMRFHIDEAIAAKVRGGMDASEARRQVMVEFGGFEAGREEAYRLRPGWLLETLMQDVRYALRGFRRAPVFALTALMTLTVAIGATTAVFGVVDRILFRPLPYADGERVVSVGLTQPLQKMEFTLGGFYFDWAAHQQPFTAMTYERGAHIHACELTEAGARNLECARVAQNFLTVFGVDPILGRNFLPEEDLVHGPAVAILTYGLWQSRYHRDPAVAGKAIAIDGESRKIVGVLPKGFQMPRLDDVDVVLPAAVDPAAQKTENSGIGIPLWAYARLKPGVSVEQAKAALDPLYRHTQDWIPAQIRNGFHLVVRPVRALEMEEATGAAWVLLAAVAAVLLIACANVAWLFLARGAARERELSVRAALGASRARLAGQAMVEALLLAFGGAVCGSVLAVVLLRVFVAIAPAGIPFLATARLDLRVAGFVVLMTLVCALIFGLTTATQRPRPISEASRGVASGSRQGLRRTLVVGQIAVSVVLASGALLLLKSFHNLESQKLGFTSDGLVTAKVTLNWRRYSTADDLKRFYLRAEAALKSLPGVTSVAIVNSLPPDDKSWHAGAGLSSLHVLGTAAPQMGTGVSEMVMERKVTPAYFSMLGIPMVEGSGFTEAERDEKGASAQIVLSRTLAKRLFPGGGAVGQRIEFLICNPNCELGKGPAYTVDGVAADVKNAGLTGDPMPEYYLLQADEADWSSHSFLVVKSDLPVAGLAQEIERKIAEIDPMAPVEVESVGNMIDRLADRPRFETALLGFFAIAGLVIAVIGLYGVTAYTAARRTQEMGVRIALGATRGVILRIAAWEGARLVLLGCVAGVGTALLVTRVLRSLLFGVEPRDPAVIALAVAMLAVTALVATLIPARRAMRIDPVEALRQE